MPQGQKEAEIQTQGEKVQNEASIYILCSFQQVPLFFPTKHKKNGFQARSKGLSPTVTP